MTKARLHPSLLDFTGAMGDMVFKRRGKNIYVSIKAKGTGDPSEAQLVQRKVFKKAVNYATAMLADETSRAFYEDLAQRRETTARAVCVKDFLKPPAIDGLDFSEYRGKVGDRILVDASDDVGVVRVNVELSETDGQVIESGQAVRLDTGNWAFTATTLIDHGVEILVRAEAYDRPGHRTVLTAAPTVGITK